MLSLGIIDVGSTYQDRRTKSLSQRWFTKCKVDQSKEEISVKNENSFIARHTIVAFECAYGSDNNKVQSVEHFRVLAIFSKYYNKWFCIKEEEIEWYQNYTKGKYRVLARQIS